MDLRHGAWAACSAARAIVTGAVLLAVGLGLTFTAATTAFAETDAEAGLPPGSQAYVPTSPGDYIHYNVPTPTNAPSATPSAGLAPLTSEVQPLFSEQGHLGRVCNGTEGTLYCPNVPLYNHHGRVQTAPQLYLIYWDEGWESASTLLSELKAFYHSLTIERAKDWQDILTQYYWKWGKVSPTAAINGEYWEKWTPSVPVENQQVEERIEAVDKAEAWPLYGVEGGAAPNAQFVVLLGPGAKAKVQCGFHGYTQLGLSNGGKIEQLYVSYSVVPYIGDIPTAEREQERCLKPGGDGSLNHETVATAAHEFAESATDPAGEAWYANDKEQDERPEVADICQSGDYKLPYEPSVWVQGLWDNKYWYNGNKQVEGCRIEDEIDPPLLPPTARTGLMGVITETSAALNGEVDPNGNEAPDAYGQFEYGKEANKYTNGAPAEWYDLGWGEVFVPMPETKIEGLEYCTTYHYQLFAYNFTDESSPAAGGDREFRTVCPPPTLTNVSAEPGRLTATLHGSIDPRNSETEYWFEWGKEKGKLINSIPTSPGNAGHGYEEEKKVSATIEDLHTGTVYYYRLVATNLGGTSESPEQSFETNGAPEVLQSGIFLGESTTGELETEVNPWEWPTTVTMEWTGEQPGNTEFGIGEGISFLTYYTAYGPIGKIFGKGHSDATYTVKAKNVHGERSTSGEFVSGPFTVTPSTNFTSTSKGELEVVTSAGIRISCPIKLGGTSGNEVDYVQGNGSTRAVCLYPIIEKEEHPYEAAVTCGEGKVLWRVNFTTSEKKGQGAHEGSFTQGCQIKLTASKTALKECPITLEANKEGENSKNVGWHDESGGKALGLNFSSEERPFTVSKGCELVLGNKAKVMWGGTLNGIVLGNQIISGLHVWEGG